ncbi:hypothetical protein ZIOFF_059397 [Zingiber officinale]|uniref:Mitochondrion protein n=1 Tax=Zingiber officinale TaxID=94328 RepID=A0A8J5F987_ZINOF|nr:hypothetical protein ZIOFF_059397 [Zingiber officinale]
MDSYGSMEYSSTSTRLAIYRHYSLLCHFLLPIWTPMEHGIKTRVLLVKTNGNRVNRVYLVDTLALVRKLETQGLPTKQAEAITSTITETLNDSLENVIQSFVSKSEMDKEHHFSSLQRETGKLQGDIEKLRSELRYEVDKVTAGHRLDLNLERGRIRDELATQATENNELTNKLDREIHSLRTQLETAKYDVIKYCVGTIVSISTVGLAFVRIWMKNL